MERTTQKKKAIELFGLTDNDEAEALLKVNNPRGKTKLHYDVVNIITINYPHVLIAPGLGEKRIHTFWQTDQQGKRMSLISALSRIKLEKLEPT